MSATPIGNLVAYITANNDQFLRTLKVTEQRMNQAANKMISIGGKMSLAITTPLTLMARSSVRAFGDFDEAMTKSTSIMSDVTPRIRKEMEDLAKQMSTTSTTSATDLADSYYFLASAGLTAEQSMASLNSVNQFGIAGAFDAARATDILTDAQSALGLKTEDTTQHMVNMNRVSDVLVKAANLANASVEQFGTALTNKAAASLRNLNKDVEEGVAVLAAFADQGMKAELGGEKLAIVLRDLQTASTKNTEEWDDLGMSVFDAQGKMLPLVDIISQLEGKFEDMSDEQKKNTAEMLGFQDRSFQAIQSLIGTSDAIRGYERELRKAGGTTQDVADKQMKSFNAQMAMLNNRVNLVAQSIGERLVPYIMKLSAGVDWLVKRWEELNDNTKDWIVFLGIIAAAAGPVLVMTGLFTMLLAKVVALAPVLLGAAAGVLALGKVILLSIVSPIGLAIAAIGYLGHYLLTTTESGKAILEWFGETWRWWGETVGRVLDEFEVSLGAAFGLIKDGELAQAVEVMWNFIKMTFAKGIDFIALNFGFIYDAAAGVWDGLVDGALWAADGIQMAFHASFSWITKQLAWLAFESTKVMEGWKRITAGNTTAAQAAEIRAMGEAKRLMDSRMQSADSGFESAVDNRMWEDMRQERANQVYVPIADRTAAALEQAQSTWQDSVIAATEKAAEKIAEPVEKVGDLVQSETARQQSQQREEKADGGTGMALTSFFASALGGISGAGDPEKIQRDQLSVQEQIAATAKLQLEQARTQKTTASSGAIVVG